MKIISNSESDTQDIGRKLGEAAEGLKVISLDGELGAGKTVFSKGFAQGLGVKQPVCSPTFTIVQEYHDGRLPLFHFDTYRIEDPDEMMEIGFEEYLFSDGVCLVEWGGNIAEILPDDTVFIKIDRDMEQGFDHRRIEIACSDEGKLEKIKAALS